MACSRVALEVGDLRRLRSERGYRVRRHRDHAALDGLREVPGRVEPLDHALDPPRPQTGGQLVLLEGAGHGPHVRDPVKVNLLLRDFAAALLAELL